MSAETNGHKSDIQLPMFDTGEAAAQAEQEAKGKAYFAGVTLANKTTRREIVDNAADVKERNIENGTGRSASHAEQMVAPIHVADLPNEGAIRAHEAREQRRAAGKPVGKAPTNHERHLADKNLDELPGPVGSADNIEFISPEMSAHVSERLAAMKPQQPREVSSEAAEAFAASEGLGTPQAAIPLLKTPMQVSLPHVPLPEQHRHNVRPQTGQ